MNLHSLKPVKGARQRPTRVGRGQGSGKGKTCGRGTKGQMARKGHKRKPGFEGGQMPLIRRIPKRGFTNYRSRKEFAPVNVADLTRFDEGSEVTVALLRETGLVKGVFDGVKILGTGEVERKLTVKAQAFSASAQSKIEAAGGTCEVVP